MTRKDYVLIAQALSDSQGADFEVVTRTVADALERENARFDRVRFLDACFGRDERGPVRPKEWLG